MEVKELKYTLQKMYVILVDSDEKNFKAGDIITNGKETKIATQSSNFFNFKNWGYSKKDLVVASISYINLGELLIQPNILDGNIDSFDGNEIKTANTAYAAGIEALKIVASTGHKSANLAKISPEFIKLYLSREDGIKVTNVVVHKHSKDKFQLRLAPDGCIITKPVFKKFHRKKK